MLTQTKLSDNLFGGHSDRVSMCVGITPWKVAEREFAIARYLTLRAQSLLVIGHVSGLPAISEHPILEWPRVSPCTTHILAGLFSTLCSIQHLAETHSG